MDTDLISALFDHLVLPPKLPSNPFSEEVLRESLIQRLSNAWAMVREAQGVIQEEKNTFEQSLKLAKELYHSSVSKERLLEAFSKFAATGSAAWLILHVLEQNACILIHRDDEKREVVFESFEISAPVAVVLETNHALQWDFPGRAVCIPLDDFNEQTFQNALAIFLEEASEVAFDRFAARAKKGGAFVVESRDTPNPGLITEMLMSLLEGIGTCAIVTAVRKRVRDDVILDPASGGRPWRRSPSWLLLRVAAQRILLEASQPGDHDSSRLFYKFTMCAVLARLLSDCVKILHPEKVLMLQAKLCRRLAKLERQVSNVASSERSLFNQVSGQLGQYFLQTIKSSREYVATRWELFKTKNTRRIPRLPLRVPDEDLVLQMRSSGRELDERLRREFKPAKRNLRLLGPAAYSQGAVPQLDELGAQCYHLHGAAVTAMSTLNTSDASPRLRCESIAKAIIQYMNAVQAAYDGQAELMSQYLLNLFVLWVAMDSAATKACEVLRQYHPVFVPEALDMLCLNAERDMRRLGLVQGHLVKRIKACAQGDRSIFSNPCHPASFPQAYVVQSDKDAADGTRHWEENRLRIEAASDQARAKKRSELQSLTAKYDRLTVEMAEGTCVCTQRADGSTNVKGCNKCWKKRSRRRLKISIHEDFLPAESPQKAAILLELKMPPFLAAYREATWALIRMGLPKGQASRTPTLVLSDFGPLSQFWDRRDSDKGLILASRKKSFLQTHYADMKLPKQPHEVILDFGPSFSYFDPATALYIDELDHVPWYHPTLGSWLPNEIKDPFREASSYMGPTERPTSYEVAAIQGDSPPNMSCHEFGAFLRALTGAGRRWLTLVTELGSVNLNLSDRKTVGLFNRLALQAGPPCRDQSKDILREAHLIFRDAAFCERLEGQLQHRLDAVSLNNRDVCSLNILVTLALRFYSLANTSFKTRVLTMLRAIRSSALEGIVKLRTELRSCKDGPLANKIAHTALQMALLCRQTFQIFCAEESSEPITEEDAAQFFRSAIALSENVQVTFDKLPTDVLGLLLRDLSMVYSMQKTIGKWTERHHTLLESAINETWGDAGSENARRFSGWILIPKTHWMATYTLATATTSSQTVHYHLLHGHLLVDEKPLGRLPVEMVKDDNVRELFPDQHLLTRPSGLVGMEFQLVTPIDGHQVHLGSRDGQVLIRAVFRGHLLEYVPRHVFSGTSGSDLPSGLLDECVHWLNLNKRELEIRRKPRIWHQRPANWTLNVPLRTAMRNRSAEKRGTSLVEPGSAAGLQISQIFRDFEDIDKLTIFQPAHRHGQLSVELKRLGLRFSVNEAGLLYSEQLSSEVDPVQNIACLHGLESKLVLRNTKNTSRRSVLVPIGPILWKAKDIHVSAVVQNEGTHAQFFIDPLLGRLYCPPEPALVYIKALMHALTSFPIPDELTGRTGTEEALHSLRSGYSRPWTALGGMAQRALGFISSLSPKRSCYPPDMLIYQTVSWDGNLTSTIQHEELACEAEMILLESHQLETFVRRDIPFEAKKAMRSHLTLRGMIRRQLYERINCDHEHATLIKAAEAKLYESRDRNALSKASQSAFKVARRWLSDQPHLFDVDVSIITRELGNGNTVQGFDESSTTFAIELLLELDLHQIWAPLMKSIRSQDSVRSYNVLFKLSMLAFGRHCKLATVFWLVAFAKHQSLWEDTPPDDGPFAEFRHLERPKESFILQKIADLADPVPTSRLLQREHQRLASHDLEAHKTRKLQEGRRLASKLVESWPDLPSCCDDMVGLCKKAEASLYQPEKVWDSLKSYFERLQSNHALSTYLLHLEEGVSLLKREHPVSTTGEQSIVDIKPNPSSPVPLESSVRAYEPPMLRKALGTTVRVTREVIQPSSLDSAVDAEQKSTTLRPKIKLPRSLSILQSVIQPFLTAEDPGRRQYGQDLSESIEAVSRGITDLPLKEVGLSTTDYGIAIEDAEGDLEACLTNIRRAVADGLPGPRWLEQGNLSPCVTLVSLLEQLRVNNKNSLSDEVKAALLHLAVMTTKLQRLLRLQDAKLCSDQRRMLEENKNLGHTNWEPGDYPEWILFEIDNDILIRAVQADVARAIISPESGENCVLQMNMGNGKTSCVMPMAIIVLANTTNLCRVVVPKSLLLQTAQVMQGRIGGLAGRIVRHLPFTRQSASDIDTLARYWMVHKVTQKLGGVMLSLPEHVLSFKLSGFQRLADEKLEEGKRMVEIQAWLEQNCRDILDESDLTLSERTQLIYPSGQLTAIDGHPHRWLVIEEVLSLVEGHIPTLQQQFEGQVEVVRKHKGYPVIYFLNTTVEDGLNELLAEDVCQGRVPQLQLRNPTSSTAQTLRRVIQAEQVSNETWSEAMDLVVDNVIGRQVLFLLRGLLSQRIIILCLKKRWNVQYGIHPERPPLAVPFDAKGIPSQRAEYGHPDTALILTCLAFYQTGMTMTQVKQSLDTVVKSDDPVASYERWTCGHANLPSSLRYWGLIDPENDTQIEELWRYMRFDRNALNYFMNTFVFPRHAKQFSIKLQASGWDIPLITADGSASSGRLTTGFSGTNDNKRMLPRTIRQDDLPNLLSTNAEVLGYLLEDRSRECYLAARSGQRLTEDGTLQLLRDKGIRVLIDAGAHILEMKNLEVAKKWLEIDYQAEGAVYFGPKGHILVLSRFRNDAIPLNASPLKDSLENCVIYIDEGHTRGTDLNLPASARGALTLGLNQTKDHTVQAAMRLRRLGTTQSIAFIAPPEVYRSILDVRVSHAGRQHSPPTHASAVQSVDVVRWLLEQTCRSNDQAMSLHASQCLDFCRRSDSLWKHENFPHKASARKQVLESLQQTEQQTLEQLYSPQTRKQTLQLESPKLRSFVRGVSSMLTHADSSNAGAMMEVEQEREVTVEVEQIRERQSLTRHQPLAFPGLCNALLRFALTGYLETNGPDPSKPPFLQAFQYVGSTKIGRQYGVSSSGSRLFVTREFSRTVAMPSSASKQARQDVLRPVHWILWSPSTQTAVIVIPEEAESLLPRLRTATDPQVWLLSYSAPTTKSMHVFNSLTYLTVPARLRNNPELPLWLVIEVGVLGGRLYFEYPEYPSILAWLGISKAVTMRCQLRAENPLQFVREWLTYRRQTEDVLYTPMGFVCQRKQLREDHVFFSRTALAPEDISDLADHSLEDQDEPET